jgi:fumarylacetoacetase
MMIDGSHSNALKTWVPGAEGHLEFPIQNIPHCIFSVGDGRPQGGIAIGDYILDIGAVIAGAFADADALAPVAGPTLNPFFALPSEKRAEIRQIISGLLAVGSPCADVQGLLPGEVDTYLDQLKQGLEDNP